MKRSLRIIILLSAGTILRLTVAFFILVATTFSLFSQRSYLFGVLESTNAYQRIPLVVLHSSASQQLGQEEATQLGSEFFAPIVLEAAPKEVAELAAVEIVNAHYDWLEGKSESVEFRVDLSSSKDAIVDGIVSYAINRYQSLEECQQVVSGYDFFSVPCQIIGLNIELQEKNLREQLENTPILLRESIYTDENLLTDVQGRSIDESAPWLRSIYEEATTILLVTGLAILFLIAVNLLGASSFTKGIRRVGKLLFQGSSGFLITAVVIFILLPLFGFGGLTTSATDTSLKWQEQTYDALFNDIIGQVVRDFVLRGVLFCIPFALIGAGGWLYGSYQLERARQTGVSLVGSFVRATLDNSGLVSSEKSKTKKKKVKKEHRYPIASSETRPLHKIEKTKRSRKKSKKSKK